MKTKFQEGDTIKIINSECKNEYYQNLIGKQFIIDKIDLKYKILEAHHDYCYYWWSKRNGKRI